MTTLSRHWVILSIVLFSAVIAAQVNRKSVPRSQPVSPQVHAADMRLFDNRGSENLAEQAERLGEAHVVVERDKSESSGVETSPESLLSAMVCSADAVSVVTIKGEEPSLSRRQTWVFTEYPVSVGEIIKNNAMRPLKVGQNIVVARSGGQLKTATGKGIRLEDLSFPSFRPGRYLLFMRYVPESGQYTTSNAKGAFRVLGPRLLPLVSDRDLFKLTHKYDLSRLSSEAKKASCAGVVQ